MVLIISQDLGIGTDFMSSLFQNKFKIKYSFLRSTSATVSMRMAVGISYGRVSKNNNGYLSHHLPSGGEGIIVHI